MMKDESGKPWSVLDRGQCEAYLGVGSPPVPTRPVYFPGKLKQTSNPRKRDNK